MAPVSPKVKKQKKGKIKLGYVSLIDSAPVAIAREKGFFEDENLDVETLLQPGWASIRDKIGYGELDAAQCLGSLAFAIHHGVGTIANEVVVPLIMSANGNAITLSSDIPKSAVTSQKTLREYLEKSWTEGSESDFCLCPSVLFSSYAAAAMAENPESSGFPGLGDRFYSARNDEPES